MNQRLNVALVSVGLGRVQRGFERWVSDLYDCFSACPEVDLAVFRSRGPCPWRHSVPKCLWPLTRLLRLLPPWPFSGSTQYKRDALAFALCLVAPLRQRHFDVIHVVDPPLAAALCTVRRVCPFPGKVLFTDGAAIPPQLYPPADHFHQVSPVAHARALAVGIPASRQTLIPAGVRAEEFLPAADRSALRVSHGIRPDTFVIAAVSALKREHKRLDYVIREVARLQGDVLLWIDGNPEDSEIPRLASQLLGQRMRITHLPSTKIRELYQLADVFVHAALEEAFGLAILEAACCGLPALIHDNLHFRWLLGDQAWRLDMSREGALSAVLYTMATHRQQVRERALRNSASIRARYAWQSLAKDYLTMYRKVARLSKKAHLAAEPHTLASGRGNHA